MKTTEDYESEEEEFIGPDHPDWCDTCQGEGRVPTMDFESYLGAHYKTCPVCYGKPGDGPIS